MPEGRGVASGRSRLLPVEVGQSTRIVVMRF